MFVVSRVAAHLLLSITRGQPMANRKTCLWCREVTPVEAWLPIHRALCPEHKRLRNRLQRTVAKMRRDISEWAEKNVIGKH